MKLLSAFFAMLLLAGSTAAGLDLAASPAASVDAMAAWSAAASSGPVDDMLPSGYRNPRTSEQAVAWALSQVGVTRDNGFCLRFVDLAFGRGSGPASAYLVWTGSPDRLHHTGLPPRGALVVWSNAIGRGHGHIAISLGDGRMVSTTSGPVSILPIKGFADSAYYGWMPPYFYV